MQMTPFSNVDTAVVERVIRTRRTIQKFKPDPVGTDLIEQAIELARWAPNHKHTEPWHFHLIGAETAVKIIARNTEMVREQKGDAAAANKHARWSEIANWLAITCRKSDDALRQQEDYAACCCAAQNMVLFLWAHGVGMKWTTGPVIRDAAFFDLLMIQPDQEFVVGLYQYGIPAEIPPATRSSMEKFFTRLP